MSPNERTVLEIPGSRIFELPPFLITKDVEVLVPPQSIVIEEIQNDGLISECLDETAAQRALADMATNLYERYTVLAKCWYLGKFIMDWVEQCETTFDETEELKFLHRPDIWPRADRKNVAELLVTKMVCEERDLREALGTNLWFRRLPPLSCLSDRFLFLCPTVAEKAYDVWATNSPAVALPPERFHFQVIDV